MTEFQEIVVDSASGVTTVTLNRPDRLNAWTATMAAEVASAIQSAGNDPDCRCIVVTGAGRGFCAGADISGLQKIEPGGASSNEGRLSSQPDVSFDAAPGPELGDRYPGRFGYMYACPKPIIAAINGPCAGIGLIFALYCDLRYAASEAKFTTSFSQRGLIAEHGLSWLLPRLIGEAHALDLLFTARKFLGEEAAGIGLVNRAVPGEHLMDEVNATARHLATDVSPRSVAVMKRQIRLAYDQSFTEALSVADAEMQESFATHDFSEGVASFAERRAPRFTGA